MFQKIILDLRWLFFICAVICISPALASCPTGCGRNSPCAQRNPGNGDIPIYDLIREFRLDESESRYEAITEIQGSVVTQKAYSLEERSNLTINTLEVFPRGIPHQFVFESTFRAREQPITPWYLIHVTDSLEQSQLSVVLDPTQYIVGIGLPDVQGAAQMVYFRHVSLFDEEWHKVTLSVSNDRAVLWIDCIQVQGVRGEYFEALLPRKAFDKTGGHISVSRLINQIDQPFAVPTSPLIDLQWMIFSCDLTRTTRLNCDELPQYHEDQASSFIPAPPKLQQCPAQCPPGPIGLEGRQGEKGERGSPGEVLPGIPGQKGERGEMGYQGLLGLQGFKGERGDIGLPGQKGEPGTIITRTEGSSYSYGEIQIRDICSSVLQEKLGELREQFVGLPGPPGPPGKARIGRPGEPGPAGRPGTPGLPGAPGHKGFRGEKGETGATGERGIDGVGRQGPIGPPGPQGIPGIDIVGPSGAPGDRGEAGRDGYPGQRGEPGAPGQCPNDCYYAQMQYVQQLQAAQQQQSKGPSPLNLNFKG